MLMMQIWASDDVAFPLNFAGDDFLCKKLRQAFVYVKKVC